MEDPFSRLSVPDNIEQNPSPLILPDIRYQFSVQRDPSSGEPVAVLLQIWLTSLPLLQFVIPFDRLSFAHFVKSAEEVSGRNEPTEGMNGNG